MNKLVGIDTIYWINLDRSPDRKRNMETMFQDPEFTNIPKIRIKAVDGKTEDIIKYLNNTPLIKTPCEYACTISHLDAIRQFAETDYEIALILEDDVCLEFKPYWRESVQTVMSSVSQDWEIIQLCYITDEVGIHLFDYADYVRYIRPEHIFSTAAYLITNRAAKRLIQEIYQDGKYCLGPNIQHEADSFIYLKCRTYTYKYPFFIYHTNNDSLIHPDHLDLHERSKKLVEEMMRQPQYTQYYIYIILGLLLFMLIIFIIDFDGILTTRLDGILTTRLDGILATRLDGILATRLDGILTTRLDGILTTRLDQDWTESWEIQRLNIGFDSKILD